MLLFGLLWVGAGAAAAFYGDPRLVGLARVLGLTFLLNAMGLVPFNLLTRAIEFRGRVIAEMLGVVCSLVVCLALAIAGYGVWALVLGYLGKALARNAALFWACDWRPGVRLDRAHIGDIFGFGLRVAGATTIRSLAPVVNQMIIGRALGGVALGLYSMADSIAIGPHRVSSAIIQQISLPLFSRLQRQPAELRRYFLRISKYLTALSIPAQLGLALVAQDLVTVLLSAQWLPVVGLLQVLALGAMFFVPSLPAGALLTAQGRPDLFLRFNSASSLAVAVALLAGTRFGLAGVGAAWLVTFPLARIILLIMGLRLLSLTPWEYLRQIRPAVVAAIVMAGCVFGVRAITGGTTEAFPRLIAETAVGAAAYVGALFALDRPLFREMKSIGHELLARPRP
jgi:PST family polysaccharide transporter